MHNKLVRRKSKVVMETVDQRKELHLANNKLVAVEVNPAITSKIDEDGEEKFSCTSNKKVKDCSGIEKRRQRYGLLSFHQLPEYMKDNEFIVNYYRADWPLKQAFFSLFRWHNETLNVWTHLLGFVLFLGLTIANAVHFSQVADFITMFTKNFPTSADTNVSHNSKDFSLGPTKLIDLKQEPQLQMGMTSPEMASTSWPFFIFLGDGLCWDNSDDNYLLFPPNLLHLPVFSALAIGLPHWNHSNGNLHHHNVAYTGIFNRKISCLSSYSLHVHGIIWPHPCNPCCGSKLE